MKSNAYFTLLPDGIAVSHCTELPRLVGGGYGGAVNLSFLSSSMHLFLFLVL